MVILTGNIKLVIHSLLVSYFVHDRSQFLSITLLKKGKTREHAIELHGDLHKSINSYKKIVTCLNMSISRKEYLKVLPSSTVWRDIEKDVIQLPNLIFREGGVKQIMKKNATLKNI